MNDIRIRFMEVYSL